MEREFETRLKTFDEFGKGKLLDEVRVEMGKLTENLDKVRLKIINRRHSQEYLFINDEEEHQYKDTE